jgi:hypothetical protein
MHLKTKLQLILCLLQCCCSYQIFNGKQEGNMEGPSLIEDQMWIKSASLAILDFCETIL